MRHALGPAQVFLNENGAVVHCGLLRGLEVIFIDVSALEYWAANSICRRRQGFFCFLVVLI
jgi:hypothetical protein